MTREDIVRMAKEAGMESFNICVELDDFAKLVAQRTWVGLTDEDDIDWDGGDLKSLVRAVEAKLKEKNT